jgi:uroporphyrinogen decarboxylase
MLPRERFLAAINRENPDRVPKNADFTPQALQTFQDNTEGKAPAEYFDFEARYVRCHPTTKQTDFSPYLGKLPPGSTIDEWGMGEIPAHLYHLTQMVHPMRNFSSVAEIDAYPFPDIDAPYRYAGLAKQVAAIHQQGFAVMADWTTIFEQSWYLRGLDQFMMDFYDRPEFVDALLTRVTDIFCVYIKQMVSAGVDLILTGDDIGTQKGMMISPKLWRQWLKPLQARLVQVAKTTNPRVKVLYDSDGNFDPVIPDLIDIGIDVLGPVQPECNDPAWLKNEFGRYLSFWGSIGVQSTLPFGNPDEVRAEVKQRIEVLGSGGGLVIAPSHVIPPETPWENIAAFFEAIEELGQYSLYQD